MIEFLRCLLDILGVLFIIIIIVLFVEFFKTPKKGKAKNVDEKTMLTNVVYPSILNCVRNRYLILVSFFAYHAFIFYSDKYDQYLNKPGIRYGVPIFFALVVMHNLLNYVSNHRDQLELEGRETSPGFWRTLCISRMELLFAFIMWALIVGAYCLI